VNTNTKVSGVFPLFRNSFLDSTNTEIYAVHSYNECNYMFNLSKHLNESFSDFEMYDIDGDIIIDTYTITLNFTYGLEELI
jgi:hypothetical protein